MRAFIALDLPEEAHKNLLKLQDILKASGADVKWVEPKNIHLTLKFLGDIDDKTGSDITAGLQKIAAGHNTFIMRTKELGVFPKPTFPRVIWVGIGTGDSETRDLAARVEEAAIKLGIPAEEKPFSTHITLGRVRSHKNIEKLLHAITNASALTATYPQEFPVSKITLYKSTLSPQGPIYEELFSAPLQK
ncbi:MAG TPA: RNA 2',3'-cyclic phosphodiesterase [Candidatus Omnitrophota bacterium]|nr:RNA 2',3'-cyclic phosphodiesterase [Candidatus Omnitrophota bacterium]